MNYKQQKFSEFTGDAHDRSSFYGRYSTYTTDLGFSSTEKFEIYPHTLILK